MPVSDPAQDVSATAAQEALGKRIQEIHRAALTLLKEEMKKRTAARAGDERPGTANNRKDAQRAGPLSRMGEHLRGINNHEDATESIVTGALEAALLGLGLFAGIKMGETNGRKQPEKKAGGMDIEVIDPDAPLALEEGRRALPDASIEIDGAGVEASGEGEGAALLEEGEEESARIKDGAPVPLGLTEGAPSNRPSDDGSVPAAGEGVGGLVEAVGQILGNGAPLPSGPAGAIAGSGSGVQPLPERTGPVSGQVGQVTKCR